MKRQALPILAILVGSTLPAFAQSEVCVTCSGPPATYRCRVEDSSQLEGRRLAKRALQLLCITELARQEGHEKCRVQRTSGDEPCFGFLRSVSIANSVDALTAGTQAEAEESAAEPPPVRQAEDKGPPKTVEELARRTALGSKQQLDKTGDKVGNAVKKSWHCLTSLFKDC